MEKKINTQSNVNTPKGGVRNFDELNFKEVNIWWSKIARTFFKVDLNEKYGQLWSRDYPSSFLMKTESGNIYKVFQPNYGELYSMTGGNAEACEEVLSRPTQRCIFNPKTRKIVGIENPVVRCGESFNYAPKCTTSRIKEIVGISSSQWGESKISLVSTIEQEYKQQQKK